MLDQAILFIFNVLAIALLALFMHRLGRSKKISLKNQAQAKKEFNLIYPEKHPIEIDIINSSHAALFIFKNTNELGILRANGSKWVARLITQGDIKGYTKNANHTEVRFFDFINPRILLKFDNQLTLLKYLPILENLKAP